MTSEENVERRIIRKLRTQIASMTEHDLGYSIESEFTLPKPKPQLATMKPDEFYRHCRSRLRVCPKNRFLMERYNSS
eukprot:CAMPEP_0204904552 /NCGR_PEP_ID=MMETSP1397-20131031/4930_1 /ASSEMBLY_ACC=CAM_ASM_000891 /TAXON_ID=49980 /ORGANISM="Climacostomum Climacostomum virens, Strain Stock W-24" /LENGTH=76 /DNA_ID=CAMNT_0052073351 /DNA_START=251 /DNA_END=481 /DNA_ORIENTATION=+